MRRVFTALPLHLGANSHRIRAVSSRFLASAARSAVHCCHALVNSVLAATGGFRLHHIWCCCASFSLRCLCILVPNRTESAGTGRFLAFPRVGCTFGSALLPRACRFRVGGYGWLQFAPLVVSLRRVLTALPLLRCVKSNRIRGHGPSRRVCSRPLHDRQRIAVTRL